MPPDRQLDETELTNVLRGLASGGLGVEEPKLYGRLGSGIREFWSIFPQDISRPDLVRLKADCHINRCIEMIDVEGRSSETKKALLRAAFNLKDVPDAAKGLDFRKRLRVLQAGPGDLKEVASYSTLDRMRGNKERVFERMAQTMLENPLDYVQLAEEMKNRFDVLLPSREEGSESPQASQNRTEPPSDDREVNGPDEEDKRVVDKNSPRTKHSNVNYGLFNFVAQGPMSIKAKISKNRVEARKRKDEKTHGHGGGGEAFSAIVASVLGVFGGVLIVAWPTLTVSRMSDEEIAQQILESAPPCRFLESDHRFYKELRNREKVVIDVRCGSSKDSMEVFNLSSGSQGAVRNSVHTGEIYMVASIVEGEHVDNGRFGSEVWVLIENYQDPKDPWRIPAIWVHGAPEDVMDDMTVFVPE